LPLPAFPACSGAGTSSSFSAGGISQYLHDLAAWHEKAAGGPPSGDPYHVGDGWLACNMHSALPPVRVSAWTQQQLYSAWTACGMMCTPAATRCAECTACTLHTTSCTPLCSCVVCPSWPSLTIPIHSCSNSGSDTTIPMVLSHWCCCCRSCRPCASRPLLWAPRAAGTRWRSCPSTAPTPPTPRAAKQQRRPTPTSPTWTM
jgi:hypothetical protein